MRTPPGAEPRARPLRLIAQELFFKSGGARLSFRAWESPLGRGTVILLHDLGDHAGRHAPLAEELRERGFTTLAFDLRGHGRSSGPRGHVERFADHARDLTVFRRVAADQGRPVPQFLVGHGLGGLVAIHHLLAADPGALGGVALAAPLLRLRLEPGGGRIRVARLLARFLPGLPLRNDIRTAHLTRDPVAAAERRRDPLVHRRTTPRAFLETLGAMAEARARADELRGPLLVLSGSEDAVVAPHAMRELVERAGATDKRLVLYPELAHDLFHDVGRERVVEDLLAWLEARIPA